MIGTGLVGTLGGCIRSIGERSCLTLLDQPPEELLRATGTTWPASPVRWSCRPATPRRARAGSGPPVAASPCSRGSRPAARDHPVAQRSSARLLPCARSEIAQSSSIELMVKAAPDGLWRNVVMCCVLLCWTTTVAQQISRITLFLQVRPAWWGGWDLNPRPKDYEVSGDFPLYSWGFHAQRRSRKRTVLTCRAPGIFTQLAGSREYVGETDHNKDALTKQCQNLTAAASAACRSRSSRCPSPSRRRTRSPPPSITVNRSPSTLMDVSIDSSRLGDLQHHDADHGDHHAEPDHRRQEDDDQVAGRPVAELGIRASALRPRPATQSARSTPPGARRRRSARCRCPRCGSRTP